MNALIYLTKTTFVNKLKKALHKPSALLLILFWIAYAAYMIFIFGGMAVNFKLDSKEGIVIILTYVVLMSVPTNILMYVRKKGIIFLMSDLHFLFNTPISPKLILLYRFMKLLIPSIIMNLVLSIGAFFIFKATTLQAILFFIVVVLIEPLFETGLMMNVYANERLTQKHVDWIRKGTWGCLAIFAAYALYVFIFIDNTFNALAIFPLQELFLFIPIFGWILAPYHLIFLGATPINVICSVLFAVGTILMLISAIKMPCTGKYYEEASDYAKDYSEKRKKAKKGEVSFGKRKYKKASVAYKGAYAKAIFYRQILEYKKNRFFIFGGTTLLSLGAGLVLCYFSIQERPPIEFALFILPGLSAYFSFLMSGYATKWSKEIDNAYTFLIPDTAFRKMWYATLIEHLRALIDGLLMVIPAGIGMGLSIPQMILCIVAHVSIMAIKLYIQVICQNILGKSLGNTGLTLLKMLIQGLVLVIGIMIAVMAAIMISNEMALLAIIVYSVVICLLLMLCSTRLFERYESID